MFDHDSTTRRSALFGVGAGLSLFGWISADRGQDEKTDATPLQQSASSTHTSIRLDRIGGYSTGAAFDAGGAEIVTYDSRQRQAYVANAAAGGVEILDLQTPSAPTAVELIDITSAIDFPAAAAVTSVTVQDGLLAAAVANETKTDPGRLVTIDTVTGEVVGSATVGALPDAVALAPDNRVAAVANEGEPSEDFETVPQGSVSVVELSSTGAPQTVATADFTAYNGREAELRERGIRLFGPDGSQSAAQNMEPEYVTITQDGTTAWVSLQEANAFAAVDLDTATVTGLHALGYKDHMLPDQGFDASDADDDINIQNWPTKGIYNPDGIDTYSLGGETFIISANEGDSRDYDGYSEEVEVSDLDLDPEAFDIDRIPGVDSVEELQAADNLGNLKTTTANGDVDGDGQHEEIYSYGARSFSIWDTDGNRLFDSGDTFEHVTAERYPEHFNNDNDASDPDGRSNDKGPEPEGVSVGAINNRRYAFISFERMSGIVVYEVTTPENASFVQYINPRNFDVDIEADIINGDQPPAAAGDVGTEDVTFIPAADSPITAPLVLTANEASGTVGIFRVTRLP